MSPKRKRRQCSACIKKWQVALQITSSMPGGGKVEEPKIRIARQEGLLCNPCYNEKMVAITRNTEMIEPLISDQGRNCFDLKEKVKQQMKWNVYSHRQQKRAFYKETAKNFGLLKVRGKADRLKFCIQIQYSLLHQKSVNLFS